MSQSRVVTLDQAIELVGDGCRLGIGGVLLQRKPIAFLSALVTAGRTEIAAHSFLASLDLELLAAHGRLAASHTGYVGFEQLGFAPAYGASVDRDGVVAHEYTEFLFVAGLRAALAGLPFMPAKGGQGSDALAELGFETITCPYTGTPVVAVPAMDLDVTVIHAEAADVDGNVMGPAERDFLFDLDANMARAAERCIVTVERLVTTEEIVAKRDRTLLFGYEVDAVVEVSLGAAPTSLPGVYPADLAAIQAYLAEAAADPAGAAEAMNRLVGAGALAAGAVPGGSGSTAESSAGSTAESSAGSTAESSAASSPESSAASSAESSAASSAESSAASSAGVGP